MPAINQSGGFTSNSTVTLDAGSFVTSMSVNLDPTNCYTQFVHAEFGVSTALGSTPPGFLLRDSSNNIIQQFYCVGELGLQVGGTGRLTNNPTATAENGTRMAQHSSQIAINGAGGLGFGRYFLNMIIHPTAGTTATLMPPCATFKFSYLSSLSNRPVETGIGFVRANTNTNIAKVDIVCPGATLTGSMNAVKVGAPT